MGITASRQPLAAADPSSALPFALYDEDEVLEIKPDVAQGYLILLSGGAAGLPKRRRSKRSKSSEPPQLGIDDNALMLSFAALTDGNVVDACFGVPQSHPVDKDSDAYKAARVVKLKISQATDTSEEIRRVAVEAYAQAFRVVLEFHDTRGRYPFCLRCFKEGSIHRQAEASLKKGFETLTEALVASTQ